MDHIYLLLSLIYLNSFLMYKLKLMWQINLSDWLTEGSHFLPQEVDSMRSAYYSDLCSKFMIENTILKMEYAEVRVFSISDKVCSVLWK